MTPELENGAYTVGWICGDHISRAAAHTMLDEEHAKPQFRDPSDDNSYLLGKVGQHNVAIACLPAGMRGIGPAAIAASKMLSSFQKIRVGLLVGIGGGIPSDDFDIRLGDVAVSIPDSTFGGVVQFDMGKATPTGFTRTGSLNKPPTALLTAITDLRGTHELHGSKTPGYLTQMLDNYPRLAETYAYQGREKDRLFPADYPHQDATDRLCKKCQREIERAPIQDTMPSIHYGTIASSNKIIEDGLMRDRLREELGAICAETEAAGLMDNFPCVVIRGICNYADSHRKGAECWRQYASATAAAFAKELLHTLQARDVVQGPLAHDILSEISVVQTELSSLKQKTFVHNLPTVSGAAYDSHSKEPTSRCYPGTRIDLLRQVGDWAKKPDGKRIFWLSGSAGTGKSTISRTLAHSLHGVNQLAASFFFKRGEAGRADAAGLFTTIATQLAMNIPAAAKHIQRAVETVPAIADKMLREQFNTLVLQPILRAHEEAPFVFPKVIVLDALDECSSEDMETILWIFRDAEMTADTLRLFVTSRPDIQVLRGFGGLSSNTYQDMVLQNIPEETTKNDLRIYLTRRLRDIREKHNNTVSSSRERLPPGWPGEEKISILVDMAVPLFIFAATTCRFLSDLRHDPNDQLATILKYRTASQKLHQTYLPVLDQLVGDQSDAQRNIVLRRFCNIVGAIVLLLEPLSASQLARLLKVRPGEVYLQLDCLHSVLQTPHDDSPIRLLHLSFRDFLTESTTHADFRIDEKKRHLSLANQCLERMGELPGLTQDICGLNSPGVLAAEIAPEVVGKNVPGDLRYACLYWVNHLVEADGVICDRDKVHQFLKKYFLHWIEALSLLESLHKATSYIQKLQGLVISTTRGKQISAFLYDAKRFLLYNFSAIEEAPLQAYSSALIFSPNNSLIRKAFQDCVPKWITRLPNVTENWSALEQTFDPTFDTRLSGRLLFSPDGTKLVCGPQIWDVTSGQTLSILNTKHQWPAVFLSNHEQIFAAEGQLVVRNLRTEQTTRIPCPGNPRFVESASGNGPRLVVLREARPTSYRIRNAYFPGFDDFLVYDIDSRKVLRRGCYWLHADSPIFFSLDGRRMALIGEILMDGKKAPLSTDTEPGKNSRRTIRLEVCSLDNGKIPRIFLKDYEDIRFLAVGDFSADGSKIAVCLAGPRVSVIDVNANLPDKKLDCSDSQGINCLAFSPRGNTLAIASDSKTYLWNFDTDEVNPIVENDTGVSMVFSPDGLKLAIRTIGGLIKVYDVRAGLVSSSHERAYNENASDLVVFSPCGTMVSSSPDYGCHVSIWNASKRKVVQTELVTATEDGFPCLGELFVAFSGSKQLFALVGRSLKAWSMQSGRLSHAYTTKILRVDTWLTCSEDGSKLVGYNKHPSMLHVVDTKSGQSLASTRIAGEQVIIAKFSKNGSKLAVGIRHGLDGMVVELRDTNSLRLEKRWTCNTGQIVGQVAFCTDENFIMFDAAAPYTTVGDQSTGRTFVTQTSPMTRHMVFISKDCRWILSPNGTRMLYIPPEVRPPKSEIYLEARPASASVHGNTVALGNASGHVTFIDFDFSRVEE
ncbi:hypothetical protein BJY00DRAFT_282468 [Aspergillus carlsbadensis]|nr:hypothetical protein BJY00DRAFT_282468 [Aspergillus carlsbadensis]